MTEKTESSLDKLRDFLQGHGYDIAEMSDWDMIILAHAHNLKELINGWGQHDAQAMATLEKTLIDWVDFWSVMLEAVKGERKAICRGDS